MGRRLNIFAQALIFLMLIVSKNSQAEDDFLIHDPVDLKLKKYQEYLIAQKFSVQLDVPELGDETIFQELWGVSGALYNKLIETTALYFTGMFIDSNHFYQQIIFELGKHLLYMGKILGLYIPKLLNNPHISWKLKVKRCVYISSFLIVVVFWMQEFYRPVQHQGRLTTFRNIPRSYMLDYDSGSLDSSMNVFHRQLPSLNP